MGRGGGFGMGRGGGRGTGRGRGMGMGGGHGTGRGMGMDGGRGMGRGMVSPMGGVTPPEFTQQYSDMPADWQVPQNAEQEISMLQQQSKTLQNQLGQVNARLHQLQQGPASTGLIAFVAADKCTGCGRCISVCPTSAIFIDNAIARIEQTRCSGCGQCVGVCPQKAIALGAR
jgi:ferredoxin